MDSKHASPNTMTVRQLQIFIEDVKRRYLEILISSLVKLHFSNNQHSQLLDIERQMQMRLDLNLSSYHSNTA